MTGTYAVALAVVVASMAIGQAAVALCGVRRWSWLSPAVGLALVCAICWSTVRLPGEGVVPALLVALLTVAAIGFLWGRVGSGRAPLVAIPVALLAAAAASLPFLAEGHFGILGTGFNPDMSQHLLAADRLADGAEGQLFEQGYPLGPHAVVVAVDRALGVGMVQAFSGLTLAVAVLAPLTALAAFGREPGAGRGFAPLPVAVAALLVGLPYLVASYYAQGSFKETMQALFLLAFVLALREASRDPDWRDLPLRFVPAAIVAIGSVYAYSFPGLLWLGGALVLWLLIERDLPVRGLLLALIVFLIGALPELGRMIDFQRFETFDPAGPGLGNLFGQISPFAALGIWPSGDFRVAPGDGAVPAAVFYLGATFAAVLLLHGLTRCWRRRESALLAGVLTAAGLYIAARVGGTPYTAAKALEIASPLVVLSILSSAGGVAGGTAPEEASATAGGGGSPAATGPAAMRLALIAYVALAGACSLLALANAPVGPTEYSPALAGMRPLIAADSTLVLVPDRLLDEEQGERYVVWELRGGRVCVERESAAGEAPPAGVRFVVTGDSSARPPFPGFEPRRAAAPYLLWERRRDPPGPGPCPPIEVRQARQGP